MNATRPRLESWLLAVLLACAGCRGPRDRAPPGAMKSAHDAGVPWAPKSRAPTPPQGMVWIPEGALIAGTPPDRVPRLADEELAGLQVVLSGFFIDVYAHPNEEGAIPQTGATLAQAEAACADRGKRLCSELEWERACKGPRNLTYEYGDRYRADACSTGKSPRMLPSGYRQACRSEFGVRDMHGGIWEWTASRWGRGTEGSAVSVRGGNSPAGELVGRCANGMPRAPASSSAQVGFRCCKGPVNEAAVNLRIVRGPALERRERVDLELRSALDGLLPRDIRQSLEDAGGWQVTNTWDWRPTGNVELVVAGGCAGEFPRGRCGVLISQLVLGSPQFIAWVWAGLFPPVARIYGEPRRLWIYGGDRKSRFRQGVHFESGRVRIDEMERRVPKKEN
jgi:sulfatase modifying factor 1